MKSRNRFVALLGATIVLTCAFSQAANVTHAVNDGFGASSFATAGNTQQETATVVGTVTQAGSLLVTVTSANVVGSPLAFNVPVLAGDVANTVAANIRAALGANTAITSQFTVGGTNAAVLLTGNVTTPIPLNDTTLNISIANGTAAGITAVVNSANTRAVTRFWSDGFAPNAANDYFTASDKMLRTTTGAGDVTFAGNSLQLDPRATSVETFVLKGSVTKTITFNSLKLNGGLIGNGDVGSTYTIAGPMSVIAPTGVTMGTNGAGAARAFNFTSTITGSSPLILGAAITGTPVANGSITLSGNNTGFSGGVSVGGSYTNTLGVTFNLNPLLLTVKANHANAFGTGTLSVNGGTLDLNGISPVVGNFTGSGGTVINGVAGTAILNIGANDGTGGNFAGNITDGLGAVGITKTGTGSLTLSGTGNTYTGDTTVNGGTLSVPASQAGSGNVIVADGASFGVNVATSGEWLPVNTLTSGESTGATIILNSGSSGNPSSAPINASTLTLDAPTVLKLQGTALTVGSGIPLISYGSVGGTSGLGGLSLQLPARTLGSLDTSTSGLIKANITSFEQIKWAGNVSGVWDIDATGSGASGTLNWKTTTSNVSTRYLQGSGGIDSVNFDDSATGSTSITINGANVSPAGLVFNNALKNYTFSGSNGIAGTTALTKGGSGSVTLGTPNSFSGGINLNAGTLALSAANTISGVIHLNSGTLDINHANALGTTTLNLEDGVILDNTSGAAVTLATVNAQTWNGDLTFTGTNDLNLGIGTIAMPFGSAVTTTAGNLTIGGIVSGPGSTLTKKGAGTLTLNGANTHSGGTTIEAGTVASTLPLENFTLATAFNTLGTGPVDVASGALLTINSGTYRSTFANSFSGAGTVNISSSVADAPAGNYTGEITLSGSWSLFTGHLNLTTPTGRNNRVAANLGGTFVSPDATATVSVGAGTTLWLSGSGQELSSALQIAGTGNGENRGALRLDGVSATGPVTLTGNATIGSSVGTFAQSISGVISGAFELATSTLGGRTIQLSGNNNYSGGTLIQGCSLEAAHDNALGSGAVNIASSDAGFPARLLLADTVTVGNAITLSGTQAGLGRGLLEGPSSGLGTVSGPITISAAAASGGHFASSGNGVLNVQGAVNSSLPVTVRDGTVMFSGGGNYTNLNVIAGTTMVGAGNGICSTAVVDVGTGGTATLDLNGFNQQLGGLVRSAANPATVTNSAVAASVLSIDTSGTPDYSGDISGPLALVKSGSGTQTLSGAVSYSGDTTVSSGTLSLAAVNAANDATTINIGASATLNLTFAGTDTVDKLFIGGIQRSPGVYKAIGNPASGIGIAQITGSGTLTVTSGPAGGNYASWASANGATSDPTADHDKDGVENGIEYFMGQSGSGFTSLPVPDSNGKVSWPKDPAYSGTFAVETSSNLSVWTTQTHTVNGNQIEYTLPSGQGKLFVRLLVTPN
jgi:autotransporter-associated beta strand protein